MKHASRAPRTLRAERSTPSSSALRPLKALTALTALCSLLTLPGTATAQSLPPSGYGSAPSYGAPGYGAPGYGSQAPGYASPPPTYTPPRAPDWELGLLYGSAATYGVGVGVWLDAELDLSDPALTLIPPVLLGGAGALGAYALEEGGMPPGLPTSLAMGMAFGAGNGLGVALNQTTREEGDAAWGFRGYSRAQALGAGLGTAVGWGYHELAHPSYGAQGLIASAGAWGALLGGELGLGVSRGPWSQANDSLLLGSLVGFDAGAAVAATGVATLGWSPTAYELGMMWGGFAVGTAASSAVYLFYLGGDHDPRRGLVFQSVAGVVGIGAGAVVASRSERSASTSRTEASSRVGPLARIQGGGPMVLPGGLGVQVFGEL